MGHYLCTGGVIEAIAKKSMFVILLPVASLSRADSGLHRVEPWAGKGTATKWSHARQVHFVEYAGKRENSIQDQELDLDQGQGWGLGLHLDLRLETLLSTGPTSLTNASQLPVVISGNKELFLWTSRWLSHPGQSGYWRPPACLTGSLTVCKRNQIKTRSIKNCQCPLQNYLPDGSAACRRQWSRLDWQVKWSPVCSSGGDLVLDSADLWPLTSDLQHAWPVVWQSVK